MTAREKAAAYVMEIMRGELGYREKASNADLDDKTANAVSGNYTKFAAYFDRLWNSGPAAEAAGLTATSISTASSSAPSVVLKCVWFLFTKDPSSFKISCAVCILSSLPFQGFF